MKPWVASYRDDIVGRQLRRRDPSPLRRRPVAAPVRHVFAVGTVAKVFDPIVAVFPVDMANFEAVRAGTDPSKGDYFMKPTKATADPPAKVSFPVVAEIQDTPRLRAEHVPEAADEVSGGVGDFLPIAQRITPACRLNATAARAA